MSNTLYICANINLNKGIRTANNGKLFENLCLTNIKDIKLSPYSCLVDNTRVITGKPRFSIYEDSMYKGEYWLELNVGEKHGKTILKLLKDIRNYIVPFSGEYEPIGYWYDDNKRGIINCKGELIIIDSDILKTGEVYNG